MNTTRGSHSTRRRSRNISADIQKEYIHFVRILTSNLTSCWGRPLVTNSSSRGGSRTMA